MKASVIVTALLIKFTIIKAGYNSNCDIEGITKSDWNYGIRRSEYINDIHEGLIEAYPTTNISAITKQTSRYLKAILKNGTLEIHTTEKFKDFEKEFETSEITIEMTFNCTENTEESLKITQRVTDTNNHDPVLSQEIYEYYIGMRIPEDYDLTKFLPISANDTDFSNRYMYFTIDYSQDLVVLYHGKNSYKDEDNFYTTFNTLREIKGLFKEEYTLTAIDGGEPKRNSTARLILTVVSDESDDTNENNGPEGSPHPPVFAKHLYFADYTSDHELRMECDVSIKKGAGSNTNIKQSGYQKYFQVFLAEPKKDGVVKIETVKPLPKYVLETTDLLIIEIEAEDDSFPHTPGRTALIIRLSSNRHQNSNNCNITHFVNFQNSNSRMLVLLFISFIFIIVIMNVGVLVWYYRRRQPINSALNYPPMAFGGVQGEKSVIF